MFDANIDVTCEQGLNKPRTFLLSLLFLFNVGDYLHRHHSNGPSTYHIRNVIHKQSITRRNMSFIIHFQTHTNVRAVAVRILLYRIWQKNKETASFRLTIVQSFGQTANYTVIWIRLWIRVLLWLRVLIWHIGFVVTMENTKHSQHPGFECIA